MPANRAGLQTRNAHETTACRGRVKLPFAEYSVACPPERERATAGRSLTSLGTIRFERYAPLVGGAARTETPGTKFAGGHRSRVTPVPIPNTEVKPATADGTVWETVWESRSLPALILGARCEQSRRALRLYAGYALSAHTVSRTVWALFFGPPRTLGGRLCGRVGPAFAASPLRRGRLLPALILRARHERSCRALSVYP